MCALPSHICCPQPTTQGRFSSSLCALCAVRAVVAALRMRAHVHGLAARRPGSHRWMARARTRLWLWFGGGAGAGSLAAAMVATSESAADHATTGRRAEGAVLD